MLKINRRKVHEIASKYACPEGLGINLDGITDVKNFLRTPAREYGLSTAGDRVMAWHVLYLLKESLKAAKDYEAYKDAYRLLYTIDYASAAYECPLEDSDLDQVIALLKKHRWLSAQRPAGHRGLTIIKQDFDKAKRARARLEPVSTTCLVAQAVRRQWKRPVKVGMFGFWINGNLVNRWSTPDHDTINEIIRKFDDNQPLEFPIHLELVKG